MTLQSITMVLAIIGALFMSITSLPAILVFVGLDAIGEMIRGVIGAGVIAALKARRIEPGAVRG